MEVCARGDGELIVLPESPHFTCSTETERENGGVQVISAESSSVIALRKQDHALQRNGVYIYVCVCVLVCVSMHLSSVCTFYVLPQ